jgi:hypothetical protein
MEIFRQIMDKPSKTPHSLERVTEIKPAKVDTLDGFAGVAGDSYRVYLGKDAKVFMFTFPGAKTNTDLSNDQVNLLTSFKFSSSTTTTTPSTTPSTPSTTSTAPQSTPADASKAYYGDHANAGLYLSLRANSCFDQNNAQTAAAEAACGIEGTDYFDNAASVADVTFQTTDQSNSAATVYVITGNKVLFTYSMVVETVAGSPEWRIDKITDLRS